MAILFIRPYLNAVKIGSVQPEPIYTETRFHARTIAIGLCCIDRLDSLGCHFVVLKHTSSFGIELQDIVYNIS